MSASTETELKFQLDPRSFEKLLADPEYFSDTAETRNQISTYFDTPHHALRQNGLSLRIRRIGDRRIQTVKAESAEAASLFVRSEWERDIAGDTPEIDGLILALSHIPLESGHDLAPVFSVDVTRTAAVVTRRRSRIEMAADRGRIAAGAREEAICEIELELLDGDPCDLFALARELAADAPLKLGLRSKSERGYALLAGDDGGAVRAGPIRLMPDMPAVDAFTTIIGACLRHFQMNEERLLRSGGVEPLHQSRVALRRLRSALSIFGPMVSGPQLDRLKAELKWISAPFGEVRNIDVLIDRIGEEAAPARLRAARRRCYSHLARELGSRRMRLLMIDLAEWLTAGEWRDDDDTAQVRAMPVSLHAGKVLDRLRRRIRKRGADLAGIDEHARHQVRILAKKLRYAGEFFASLYPGKKAQRRHEHFLAAIGKLQTALGDLNDLAAGGALWANLDLPKGESLLLQKGKRRPRSLIKKAQHHLDELIETKRFWR